MKKIVALILARSGSKIINKIKKFKNKPLIYWTIDTAINLKNFMILFPVFEQNFKYF